MSSSSLLPGRPTTSPTTSVELSISCSKLADMDTFSKSDPFAVLYLQDRAGRWLYQDRTETIDNTLNPHWAKRFVLSFQFEMRQMLRVEVYDSDSESLNLAHHDFIGACECSLGEILATQGMGDTRIAYLGAQRPLVGVKKDQTITLVAEELVASKEMLNIKLSGHKLDRKDWWGWGSSDPFLTILKSGEFGQWRVVHRTEVLRGELNPGWGTIHLSISSLCNADHSRALRLKVEDWNQNGSHSMIGEVETSVEQLLLLRPGGRLPLVNPKKKGKLPRYKDSGQLIVHFCQLELRSTFLDYIQGGMELSFTVAIDFTASNGDPSLPSSLHYKDPSGRPNQYLTAITAVGDIIQDYDTDKLFPALGFGALLPPDSRLSHDFSLDLTSSSPYCKGVEGIIKAYYKALNSVELYGPTNFSPVIQHVARCASKDKDTPRNYHVLLIITDGIICDLAATKEAIIGASSLPMSIIIVGVGQEDFTAMDELDSDDSLLHQGELTAERDIVQFVPMHRFLGNREGNVWNKDLLAREVLAELPQQIVSYMHSRKLRPGRKASLATKYPIH